MSNHEAVRLFSPQISSLELLDKNLTKKRRDLAERLLEDIRDAAGQRASRYDLIVGPRGTGKTHLLSFMRQTLQEGEAGLRIVHLSEEERGVGSHLDFLVACLRVLGVDIARLYDRLKGDEAGTKAEQLLLEQFGKKPGLIIIENLHALLRSLDEDEQRRLRSLLQRNAQISVLASSPRLFEDSGRPDHPFHGFFMIHRLEKLSHIEARDYLIQLARWQKNAPLLEALQRESAQARINAVYDLTGGNHRLLGMLSECLEPEGLQALVEPFMRLVDRELTPYYQQRLDELPAQQNKILRAMARETIPMPVKEIALHTFATEQTTSSQLVALREYGLVRRTQQGRESLYELQEPLLRFMLDIKEGREKLLPSMVALLRDWYEAEELKELADKCDGLSREYYLGALAAKGMKETVVAEGAFELSGIGLQGIAGSITVGLPDGDNSGELLRLAREAKEALEAGTYDKALQLWAQLLETTGEQIGDYVDILRCAAYFGTVASHYQLGQLEVTITKCDALVHIFGEKSESVILRLVAAGLLLKGTALHQLERRDEEIGVYDEVVGRIGERKELNLLKQVANALVNKGVVLAELKRMDEVLQVCDEEVKRFGEREELNLLEQVARALVSKGVVLSQLKRMDEAVDAFDEVVRRFGDRGEPEFLKPVAGALFGKGVALDQLERTDEMLRVCDEVVRRFEDQRETFYQEISAKAQLDAAMAVDFGGSVEAAVARYERLIRRFEGHEEPHIVATVGLAIARLLCLRPFSTEDVARLAATFGGAESGKAFEVVELLLAELTGRPEELVTLVEGLREVPALVVGLTQWVQNRLPMSEEAAQGLEAAEGNLWAAFADVEGAQAILELFSAARAHSLGDKRALLRLPLESRRLVERAYGIGSEE